MEKKKQDENFSRYSGVTMKIENDKIPVNCEELDHSVLQTPLNLGIRNIQQVLKCLEGGTKEVKDIILNECTIIYECKVCQNMFRSLENLLAHKRFYCKIHLCDSVFFLLENSPKETVTVEPESPREENCNHPDVDCTSHDINFADHIKNASEEPVIQISVPKMHTPTIETKDISKLLPNKSHQDQNNTLLKDDKEQHLLTTDSSIQPVFGNSDVVLHTSRTDETMDNQLSEELQKIPEEIDLSVTKQDITVITDMSSSANTAKEKKELLDCFVRQRPSTSRAKQLASRTDCNVHTLSCLRCETRYASINTLYYHMTRIHAEKRIVYPCMLCGSTFVQVWGLTRHLIYSHQKTKAQVKELKKQIKCLSYQKNNKVNERSEKTFGTFCNPNNKNKELQLRTSSNPETKCTYKFSQDSHQLYFDCQLESTAGKTDKKIKPADGISEVPNVISRPKRVAEKKMPKDFVNSQTLFSRNSKIDKNSPTKISSVKDSEKLVDFKNIFCKKCHKYFSSVSSLKRHVAVHAGVRRFKCKLCSYLSYAKSDCRTHIIRMHNKPNTTTVWVEKQILDL